MADVLREWMVKNGAELRATVVAKEMPEMGGGMGLCSSEALRAGVRLASVPPRLLFNTQVAKRHASFQHYYDESQLAPLQILSLFLAHEARDPESFWHAWVSRLPRSYDTLLECTEDELQQLGACRRRRAKVLAEQAELRRLYEHALQVISAKSLPAHLTYDQRARLEALRKLEFGEFRAFYCSVMSRGFYYEVNLARGDVWTMVPWLDYFNYTDSTGHSAGFNKNTQRFEVVTTGPVSAGDQILLHYGTYSNFELLLWYGFVLQSNRNLEYKLSPPADANGLIPTDSVGWVEDVIRGLQLEEIPWATSAIVEKWATAGVAQMVGEAQLQRWTVAPCRGRHKGVKMSIEHPPRVSAQLRRCVQILIDQAQVAGAEFTAGVTHGQLMRALLKGELQTQWNGAPDEPEDATYGARSIHFFLNEEYGLLLQLSELDDDVWQAAFQE